MALPSPGILVHVSLFLAAVSSAFGLQLVPSSSPAPSASSTSFSGSSAPAFVAPAVSSGSGVHSTRPRFFASPSASSASSVSSTNAGQRPLSAGSSLQTRERRCGSRLTSSLLCAAEGTVRRQETAVGSSLRGAVQEISMPALSSTMKEGKVVTWSKQVGDRVEPGDVLMVVESDKADMDVEAFDSGFMAMHLVREGDAAPVGTTVALLAEKEEDISLIQAKGLSLISASSSPAADSTPAVTDLLMPSLSPSLKTARMTVWRKKEGEKVNKGDVLFVVESDKADMDVEAPHDGVLAHIAVREGVTVDVGSTVGYLAPSAEVASAFKNALSDSAAPAAANPSTMPEGAQEIFMPALSSTMTSGKVSKWNKAVGDAVHVGDTLMVVESDKADMDVESFDEGYLAAITVAEGESAPVGQTVAIIVPSKDDIAKVQDALTAASTASSSSSAHAPLSSASSPSTPSSRLSSSDSVSVSSSQSGRPTTGGDSRTAAFMKHGQALARWTSPSVDQDVKDQLPEGLTGNDLQQEWLQRIEATMPTTFAALQANPQMQKALLERLNLRVPPPHTLRVSPAPPPYLKRAVSTYGAATAGAPDTRASGIDRTSRGPARDPSGQPLATFNAIELAKKNKLNLEEVKGTGTNRRITAADVRQHLHLPSDEATVVTSKREKEGKIESLGVPPPGSVPLDAMQKAVARNMEATMDVPVFRVSRGIYVDKLEAMVQELKQIVAEQNAAAIAAEGPDAPQQSTVTMSVLLAKAVALTLEKHPIMNAAYNPKDGGQIQHPGAVNVAMAVSVDGGLLTPVLRNVNTKSVFELSADWAVLVDKARKRRLTAEENSAGTFYISNLGMFGVSQFDAVLPKGVGTIMAVGGTESVPFFPKTGTLDAPAGNPSVRRRMTVTITADHRHIYGSHAAAFLKDFASLLETRPSALLI
ncbi:pyruvate dehydrogenase complex subunit PDH-E2 [Toxoplasma gondii GT1]|uniref:Dihydrolipoamide acetyltransferase component of pyruvate dehydrogenase complex n=3 Tax=Toxoplasma gondii TaxID=5811 RepID=S7UTU2_TOXGG|nr:pyruvate dehydrogenase complex subunit PDH-E2 [Toxoplasma gondii GT1]KAF4642615.1 pyruvate dehydrogenase complex subunit PDH-E2 [Toxoplasma gondii]KFG38336.1 pyruvate dehydrogenase complex subunit PDH-E2 [Toxoplasma gondii FOU]